MHVSVGLQVCPGPALCLPGSEAVASGAHASECETDERLLRAEGKKQEERTIPTEDMAAEVVNGATHLISDAGLIPANVRGVSAALSKSRKTKPFLQTRAVSSKFSTKSRKMKSATIKLLNKFKKDTRKLRELLNGGRDVPRKLLGNIHTTAVGYISRLRFRSTPYHLSTAAQLELDVAKVRNAIDIVGETDFALMLWTAKYSSRVKKLALRIERAQHIKWLRDYGTPEAVKAKLQKGFNDDKLAKILVETYESFYRELGL
ncbi:unnamed protein product [Hyaloperonospora brassicae]|uniref:RxLR effector candidate protein n=1 Tax=Hyaloperonospora brassicae TaxID=162125 RepID=A0AAV0T709_HYABA|nr:unnamed protein product [Hyaloperonospora brassicae]